MSFGPFHNTDDPRFTQDPQIRELLDVGVDVAGPWSSTTTYVLGQIAQGSDDNLYASLLSGNLDHNPVGDGGVHWVQLGGGGSGTLNQPILETADYSMIRADSVVLADATTGPITITLPLSIDQGRVYYVKKVDASDNVVTVVGPDLGIGHIDNNDNDSLTIQYVSSGYVWDGENWWKL